MIVNVDHHDENPSSPYDINFLSSRLIHILHTLPSRKGKWDDLPFGKAILDRCRLHNYPLAEKVDSEECIQIPMSLYNYVDLPNPNLVCMLFCGLSFFTYLLLDMLHLSVSVVHHILSSYHNLALQHAVYRSNHHLNLCTHFLSRLYSQSNRAFPSVSYRPLASDAHSSCPRKPHRSFRKSPDPPVLHCV